MKPYYYLKKPSEQSKSRQLKLQKPPHKVLKFLSILSFLIGCVSIGTVLYPIASYQFKQSLIVNRQQLVMPVPEAIVLEAKGILSPVKTAEAVEGLSVTDNKVQVIDKKDLTMASNWFDNDTDFQVSQSKITHYFISIPNIGIDRAVVTIGGEDLKESLVQYPGTSLPGKLGNTVILGHSVLPAFYDPTNYNTIFTKIPDLEKGDEIIIEFDGITYTYVVYDYYERQPEEVDLMEQRFDRFELSLVTCVPQGTYLRRGIIRAYLKK